VADGWHQCYFCGEYVSEGYEATGERHWLSDCRPDLVEHEPGPLCTWYESDPGKGCYAFQDHFTNQWGEEHIHFYPDSPT